MNAKETKMSQISNKIEGRDNIAVLWRHTIRMT